MPTTSLNGRLPCRTAQLEIKKLIASQEDVLACDGNLAREPLHGGLFVMTLLVMTALLIDAIFGLFFKVLVLVPAIIIGSAATLGIGMAHSNSLWFTLLAMVLAITALQMGYLGGAAIRFVSAGARVRKDAPGIIPAAQRPAR